MSNKILIVTNKLDIHPTSVINLLIKKNIPYFRLNTEALMTDYNFAWIYQEASPDFYIQDRNNGNIIWGHEIKSVWYRRPKEPECLLFSVNDEVNRHNMEESKQFYLYLMYLLSDYYSIGNHLYDKYANSKLVQLNTAFKMGIKIPATCLTNTKTDISNFCEGIPEVILKPLRNFNVLSGDHDIYHLYTVKVNSEEFDKQPEECFQQTVSFCENYVEKKYEVRITIMGSYIFSCKLDSQAQQEDTGKIDWRQGYDHKIKHEMIEAPLYVEDFCRNYLRFMKLHFGCFDFIVTPQDEYVFLECNPNGQWGWIEDELNITTMTEALVDCLVNKLDVKSNEKI